MFWYLTLPILLPAVGGCVAPFLRSKKQLHQALGVIFVLEIALTVSAAFLCDGASAVFRLAGFEFCLLSDGVSKFCSILFAVVFGLAGLFAFEYLDHDPHEAEYFGFYLVTLAALQGLCFSGSLFGYYMFYEFMSVLSTPLVLHDRTDGSRRAATTYLGYSLLGAALVLFGYFVVCYACQTTLFVAGGAGVKAGYEALARVAALAMLVGFGGKAGLFPLHAWLPIAHPEAPAPASAVLSGIITKCGLLGIVRTAYFVFGAEFLRGSYVQTVMLTLTLITVFMGSMLAYKEKLLKRRLAWSSVSQVSYALFGLFLFCGDGMSGSFLQVCFHAFAKCTLFLSAGAIIHQTGCTDVRQLGGMGKRMPFTLFCFTCASLSLIGIPPFGGFVSKWYLATGSLNALGTAGWVGCAVLLISAFLTAGYLLTIVRDAFFPGVPAHEAAHGEDAHAPHAEEAVVNCDPGWPMKLPLIVGAAALLLLGLFPDFVLAPIQSVLNAVM